MPKFVCDASAVRGAVQVLAVLGIVGSLAGETIPLTNWPVPGRKPQVTSNGNLSGLTPFVAVTPCRVVDTRNANGPFGGPSFAAGSTRTFTIPESPCGIPGAAAYSMNVTIVNYDVASAGFVTAWPYGYPRPFVSTVNFGTGPAVANAAIIAAGTDVQTINGMPFPRPGTIQVYSAGATHIILDINGYFAEPTVTANTSMTIFGNYAGSPVIYGSNTSTESFSSGVRGSASGAGPNLSGVWGSSSGSGANFGVRGSNTVGSAASAGVLGYSKARSNTDSVWERAGVRGETSSEAVEGLGVLGISSFMAVVGEQVNASTGAQLAVGILGYNGFGVYSQGNTGATGIKNFVEPHPTDATKVIRYVSLEGPEAGTYFRGRGHFVNGRAVIAVPESFRMVTEDEGLTVHLTPLGPPAAVGVTATSLVEITAESTRDGAFSYIVHGVRKGYKDFEAIAEGTEYAPRTPSDRLPEYLNASQKQRLIDNGTYNHDGTVNLSTAVKLGWAKAWAESGAVTTAASPPASQRDN